MLTKKPTDFAYTKYNNKNLDNFYTFLRLKKKIVFQILIKKLSMHLLFYWILINNKSTWWSFTAAFCIQCTNVNVCHFNVEDGFLKDTGAVQLGWPGMAFFILGCKLIHISIQTGTEYKYAFVCHIWSSSSGYT